MWKLLPVVVTSLLGVCFVGVSVLAISSGETLGLDLTVDALVRMLQINADDWIPQ